jgi:hypothetical protein
LPNAVVPKKCFQNDFRERNFFDEKLANHFSPNHGMKQSIKIRVMGSLSMIILA